MTSSALALNSAWQVHVGESKILTAFGILTSFLSAGMGYTLQKYAGEEREAAHEEEIHENVDAAFKHEEIRRMHLFEVYEGNAEIAKKELPMFCNAFGIDLKSLADEVEA